MSQSLIDILKNSYFVIIYGVTWIIAIATYKKYFNTVIKYFPLIITYTLLNELLGILVRYTDYFTFFSQKKYANANDIVYNIYDILFFGFFYFVYWKLIKSKKSKKWILYGSAIALLSYIISAFFQNPILISLYYANAISCWILLFICILYFKQLRPNLNWKEQRYNLMFWITLGLAIFHFFFPFLFVTGYLDTDVYYKYNLQTIWRILIVIMYTLFSVGFIVSRKRSFQ